MFTNKTGRSSQKYHDKFLMLFPISSERVNIGLVSMPLSHIKPLSNGLILLFSFGNSLYNAMSLNISGILRPASVKNKTVVKNLEMLISVGLGTPFLL